MHERLDLVIVADTPEISTAADAFRQLGASVAAVDSDSAPN
jgi:hypothetical protein